MSCCALFLLSFAGQLNAQIPDQLKNKLAGKTNLKNIMKEVDEYYAMDQHITSTETEDSSRNEPDDEYAKWKRWEWYMSSRLGADGSFVDISKMNREAWLNRKNEGLNQPNSPTNIEGVVTNGAWGFVGPDSYGTVWGGLPGNGRVDRVAFDPTNAAILYAGTPAGGFWKSIDYGTTWICFSDYPSALGISGIVVDKINPSIIYILTGDGDSNVGGFVSASGYERASIGVLKSTDGGKTWTPTGSFPIPGGQTFYGTSLSQCPSNTNILIAATSLGLYRTSDAGVSWNAIPYAGNYVYSDVKFNPLNGNSVYAGSGGGVGFLVSNDAGVNWHIAGFDISINGANRIQIGIARFDTANIYLLCGPFTRVAIAPGDTVAGYYGLYRSTNGGQNFTRVNNTPNILGDGNAGEYDAVDQSNYDLCIAVNPSFSNSVFIAGKTIWGSANSGVSFTHKTYYWGGPGSNAVHPDIHALEFNPVNANLYTCTDGGLYTSTSSGITWTFISDHLNCTQWYHLASVVNQRHHLVGGLQDNGIRNRTTLTSSFNHVISGDGFCGAFDPNDGSKFYAVYNTTGASFGNDGATSGGVGSTNFGSYFPFIARHPTNTNIIFAGREDSLFKSSNAGASFTKINIGGKRRIVFCPSNPSTIYSANSARVWKSTDGGNNWSDLTNSSGYPSGSPVITCVAVNPTNENIVLVTFGGYSGTKKVIYSTDGGTIWHDDISPGLPNLPVNCVAVNSDNTIYVGTDNAVYYQSSYGAGWQHFYANLPLVPVTDLLIFNGTDQMIYASTFGRGIWYSPLYGACGNSLSLSGAVSGNQNYASGNIISTQSLTGGSTVINYQSAVLTTLSPGFIAPTGTRFYAITGPCITPAAPVRQRDSANNPPHR